MPSRGWILKSLMTNGTTGTNKAKKLYSDKSWVHITLHILGIAVPRRAVPYFSVVWYNDTFRVFAKYKKYLTIALITINTGTYFTRKPYISHQKLIRG